MQIGMSDYRIEVSAVYLRRIALHDGAVSAASLWLSAKVFRARYGSITA
jgi:hypothetical protein